MKKVLLTGIFLILVPFIAYGQFVLDTFDSSVADSLYDLGTEGGLSKIILRDNTTDFVEGIGSMDMDAVVGEYHQWGSYAQIYYRVDEDNLMDWSTYDSISVWIKVREAGTVPENLYFRIHIADKPTPDADQEEYIYENATILDTETDWVQLRIPLLERESDGSVLPNDEGFVLIPDSWNNPNNNRMLDRNKILGFNLTVVTSGWDASNNLPADSVKISFDEIKLYGARSVPFIFFNGKTLSSSLEGFTWGAALAVMDDEGYTAGTNALVYTHGDGWAGAGWNIDPAYNMSSVWTQDSLKFTAKVDDGTPGLRFQMEDGVDKVGYNWTPIDDGAWHDYAIALADFSFKDGSASFDTSNVVVFQMMAEGNGVGGKNIYFDNLWTGNPSIDVVAPLAPTGVGASAGPYYNLVYWTPVPGESEASYAVYASLNPITDLAAGGVDKIAAGLTSEDSYQATHWLVYPLADTDVTYYYAVTCTDAGGNTGDFGTSAGGTTNTAKGIPTISLNVPANFAADGDLSEWDASGIMPFVITPETDNVWESVDDSDDLSATVYMAIDDNNLYVAADVIDDSYSFGAGNWWDQDAFQIFLGLYNQTGSPHQSIRRGTEPDCIMYANENNFVRDYANMGALWTPADDNYYFSDLGGSDYIVEVKIPLDSVVATGDTRFHPVRGMKVPLDIYFHDNDGGTWEGNLGFSPNAEDTQWSTVEQWFYTWIGDTAGVTAVEEKYADQPSVFMLSQNYPNPFNPVTHIEYSLPARTHVKLEVFDIMGRKVETLINEVRNAGSYRVEFDGSSLASGIYFYRLKTDSHTFMKKMMLMK
ncbi:T9SS type A sorting domain-containing protein [bacterium]|nr:T9SS type A sorting domain-containing protein [bacterium]